MGSQDPANEKLSEGAQGESAPAGATRNLLIGTAGHIDHGKTTLIRALTGVDTDRLPEEKRRGLTIELGFAHLQLDGYEFGVVDVPGHERFVRTMVAGATAIDIALLVVAADDSVMPQTVEHVEILDLLDVRRGVVAITKCDTVDKEMPQLVAEEVAELLSGRSLDTAEVIPVSSTTGAGLDRLRGAILAQAAQVVAAEPTGPFRMCIDRVFTIQGRGTVVTGSVLHGRATEGDVLEVHPLGETCRVRAVQSHHQPQPEVLAGQRAAVNLIGVDKSRLERGQELATPGFVRPTYLLDVRLRCLSSARRPIKPRSRVRLSVGTREVMGRVVTADGEPVPIGGEGLAQLRLSDPVTAVYGQRFVVRDETATRTVGGGVVLRASPKRRRVRGPEGRASLDRLDHGDPADRVEEVIRFAGFAQPGELQIAAEAGVPVEDVADLLVRLRQKKRLVAVTAGGTDEVAAATLEGVINRAVRWLERFHQSKPNEPGVQADVFIGYLDRKSRPGLGKRLFEHALKQGSVKRQGRYVCHPDHAPAMSAQDERYLDRILEEYERAAFKPPAVDELEATRQTNRQRVEKLIKIAVSTGQLVQIDGKTYLHADCEQRLRDTVARLIRSGGDASVSAIRQELDSSRKYAVPFMEYLDRVGFTRREGDQRVLAESDS